MKNNNLKDFKKRSFVDKFELILLQRKISKRLNRQFLENFKPSIYDFQVKNRCILTARSKGICSDFKLSRIKTRELASNGLINGLKKVSW
jgi:small subunit ribosomal protein S14